MSTAVSRASSIALVANARMYSVTAGVKAAWNDVLRWVLERAELTWDVIDYDPPAPLVALWARQDLGLTMMCGLPFSHRQPRPTLVAAPVPSPARYARRPIYFTDVVVRADSAFESLEDTDGSVAGYTVADSMSGCVAFRAELQRRRDASGAGAQRARPQYRRIVGDLIHGRGVIEALCDGRIDVGPLDSYYHDLLRHDDPGFAARVRTVASIGPAPIPPLIATASVGDDALKRLREALAEVATAPMLAARRDRLLLAGFATPDPSDYDALTSIEAAARRFDPWW